MMKKKLIAHTAAIALFFTTAFCGIGAPVHAAEADSTELPEIVEADYEFYRDPETGHIGIDEDSVPPSDPGESGISPNASLPPSYGSISSLKQNYPATRSQNPYGTCWAHAATACAEFDLVTNHGVSKNNADFSELQLAYFNYNDGYSNGQPYRAPGLENDAVWIPSSAGKNYLNMGGNIVYSMHTLAQWKTYTKESSLPYSKVVNNSSYTPHYSHVLYHDAAQLRNVRYLDIKNNPAAVKQAIMDYGAVYISYNHNSAYYNSANNVYYNPTGDGTNHDIVVVGWDDNVSRYKFNNTPSRNGAWLVRNSWTTTPDNGSEYTYFYMSYADTTLASTAYALDFEAGSQKDTLYQHDGSTTHSYVTTSSVANVFKYAGNDGYTSHRLDSVMVPFTMATNINYKVEIYTGLTSSDPLSGHLNSASTTTGWTGTQGIYTIDLKKPVYLYPGEKFAVVVTALNGDTFFDIETTSQVTYYENGYQRSWFSTTAAAEAGESFVYNGVSYQDVINYGGGTGNVCIKAVATKTNDRKYRVTYDLKGGVNDVSNPSGFMSTQSGSFTLKNPSRSGHHFVGWYSDYACTQKVTAINYNNKSDQTFYAKWCSNSNTSKTSGLKPATLSADGSYKTVCAGCGQSRGSGTIYRPASIKLNSSSLAYTGKNLSPKPVIKDSKGNQLVNGTDYTYKYNKSSRKSVGSYSVTVTFKGKYSGSKKLTFSIVPNAPSTASAKLYGHDDIKVSWSKSAGAAGYYVYYKTSGASSYSKYKSTTKLYINFANLSDNAKYNFKIIPYYKSGGRNVKSSKYKVVSATTLIKLGQPSMKKVSGGRVSLNWKTCKGASGYQVYWSSKKNGSYKKLCDYSKKYIGVTFSVGKGKTYYYKVRAYQKVGSKKIYGPWSTPKAFKR